MIDLNDVIIYSFLAGAFIAIAIAAWRDIENQRRK